MRLYIVRHAFAGQHGDPRYPDDALRPLTKKGRKRFRRVVETLGERGFAPTLVATSPLLRCRQTADLIIESILPRPKLAEQDALRPGGRLDELVAWSNAQGGEETAWVGHAPDVDRLLAALVGGRDGALVFAKGAVAAIDFEEEIVIGQGEMRWFVTPKMLGC
ncbi:MAG: histidine phosphatase family protein [Planctomycetia bacterium]|nr:histidine phosphatase family protein [Planctomycetia bacterium]